jgi:hypothetical protein
MSGNYWIMIPPQVAGDESLSVAAKLVYGRIFAMTTKHGYCFASNEYIGAGLDLKKDTISHLTTDLRRKKYLRIEIERNEKKEILSRRIYPLLDNLPRGIGRNGVKVPGRGIGPASVESYKDLSNKDEVAFKKAFEKTPDLTNEDLDRIWEEERMTRLTKRTTKV